MDLNLNSNLLLNLQDYSAIALAAFYWDIPPVKEKVIKYFTNKQKINAKDVVDKKWCDIIDFVKKSFISHASLSQELLEKVFFMIFRLGRKTFFWINHAIDKFELKVKQVVNIFWTSYGCVDEGKIFQLYWKNDTNIPRLQLYQMACQLAQISFIQNSLTDMVHTMKQLTKVAGVEFQSNNWKVYGMMALYICYSPRHGFGLYKRIVNSKSPSPAEELFTLCIENNLVAAAKYFYRKIKKADREVDSILQFSKSITMYTDQWKKKNYEGRNELEKEKFAETFLFLLNNFSFKDKIFCHQQFLSAICLYEIFLVCYPHQKLFLPFLKSFWNDLSETRRENLFKAIISYITSTPEIHLLTNKIFREILSWMLLKLDRKTKWATFFDPTFGIEYLEKLVDLDDFTCFNLIFNDSDLTLLQNVFMRAISSSFVKNFDSNKIKYPTLEDYVNHFALSEDLKVLCKKKISASLYLENFKKVLLDMGKVNY